VFIRNHITGYADNKLLHGSCLTTSMIFYHARFRLRKNTQKDRLCYTVT